MESPEKKISPEGKEQLAFEIELQKFLKKKDTLNNLLITIRNKINQDKKASKISRILFDFILELNPTTKSFEIENNRKMVIAFLSKLNEKLKTIKLSPAQVYNLFVHVCKMFPVIRHLFVNEPKLEGKEEQYLEILLPFLPNKNIDKVIAAVEKKISQTDLKYVKKVLNSLYLKTDKSFVFLRNVLIEIINSTNGELIANIKNMENNYLLNNKNSLLRCKLCYNFPVMLLEPDKNIRLEYLCKHVPEEDLLKPENIVNYIFKCTNCRRNMMEIYKFFLCSKCKQIFCHNCTQNHFEKCLNLFFVHLCEIGYKCLIHNQKYEFFCTQCNSNLCVKCKEEHIHYTHNSINSSNILNMKDREKASDIIDKDQKIPSQIKNFIKEIISNNNYSKIPSLHRFFGNLIDKKGEEEKCGIFEEFGSKEFNEYYKILINEAQNGNLYYKNIYDKMLMVYKNNNKKINISSTFPISESQNSNKVLFHIFQKLSALNNYFTKLQGLMYEIKNQNIKLEDDILKINYEKSEIKSKALLKLNNRYRYNAVKLLNRSIADNILRYIIKKFPDKFEIIEMNLKIYTDIYENYKSNRNLINKVNSLNNNKFKNFLQKLTSTNNNSNNNNSNSSEINNNINGNENVEELETEFTEDIDNKLRFKDPIQIGKHVITVKELNNILNYLLYSKDDGNSAAHPNNDKNKIPLSVFKPEALKTKSHMEVKDFKEKFLKVYRGWKFTDNVSINNLLECLFNWNFDILVQLEPKITDDSEDENINYREKVDEEFKILENLFILFKSIENNLRIQKNISENINSISNKKGLENFCDSLKKSLNKKVLDSALLENIVCTNYNNSITGESESFISDCFDFIINELVNKNISFIPETEETIKKLKQKRYKTRVMLELFENLNQKATVLDEQENTNDKNSYLSGLVEFLNQNNENERTINLENISPILESIKKNLRLIVPNKIKINWLKYNKQKITSLLFLCQNKLI